MSQQETRFLQSPYSAQSEKNAIDFAVSQKLREINTTFIARIDICESRGSEDGSKTVDATPLVNQVDGQGNALEMTSIPALPHYRVQQGIAAIIIDPVPGDIGVFSVAKNDISNVNQNSTNAQRPGSMREFSQSDSIMVGSIHTQKPLVWIELKQDETIVIHAPKGVKIETDETCTVTCKNASITAEEVSITSPQTNISGNVTITGNLTASNGSCQMSGGNITTSDHIKAGELSLRSHTRTVTAEGAQTSSANA